MSTLSSGYVQQLVDDTRKCAIQQKIQEARALACTCPIGTAASPQQVPGQLDRLMSRVQPPQPIPMRTESRRIQDRVNAANSVWDPAKTGYRQPVPVPCPPIPEEYVRAGEPTSRPKFECYDSVVGFI